MALLVQLPIRGGWNPEETEDCFLAWRTQKGPRGCLGSNIEGRDPAAGRDSRFEGFPGGIEGPLRGQGEGESCPNRYLRATSISIKNMGHEVPVLQL